MNTNPLNHTEQTHRSVAPAPIAVPRPTAAQHAASGPTTCSTEEWQVRCELAACYRLLAHFDLTDTVYTHVSARVPGTHDNFLINPFGLLFEEITASSLLILDVDGNTVGPNTNHGGFQANKAGFVIHSAIHAARPDVDCVVHTHTVPGMAVAATAEGLLPLNQISMQFYNRIAYHDYEGISLDTGERERLVHSLGSKDALILRHHGLLTCGTSIAKAFSAMFYLDRACQVQIAAKAAGTVTTPPAAVCDHAAYQYHRPQRTDVEKLEWPAMLRLLDRVNPGYDS